MATNISRLEPVSWRNFSVFLPDGSCNNSVVATLPLQDYQCAYTESCDCPELLANPDIAGTGVIASFILTAALTVVGSAVFLLARQYDPHHLPKNQVDRWIHQSFTRAFRGWRRRSRQPRPQDASKRPGAQSPAKQLHGQEQEVSRPRPPAPRPPPLWLEECLKRIVVGLSDQQLVTGLSVLVTACFLYAGGRISVYHFQVAQDLAWFSANTHVWSLLLTLEYFTADDDAASPDDDDGDGCGDDDDGTSSPAAGQHARRSTKARPAPHNPRGLRSLRALTAWRLLCIYATVAFLLWGSIRMSFSALYSWPACPMQCVPSGQAGGLPLRWSIANGLLIGWLYAAVVPFACLPSAARRRLGGGLLARAPRALRALWALLASTAFQVAVQVAWFAVGCVAVAMDLRWGRGRMGGDEWRREQEWGFGQVVPLVLVMLPFMGAVEVYVETFASAPGSHT